ncbi:hypothetical protein L1987_31989 [Smallanthus sonchifolius]|uniref:Uncharacterized protein n=1 Tax=Smallanthus sonchifolius TaxID=185202 RepID=A0ACB9I6Y4_9ASTR|nr:hypothetical protein L1987_31989 [Smallanthus sonchifolius]
MQKEHSGPVNEAVRAAGCFGANVGANRSANGDCFGGGCRLFMAGGGAFEAGLGAVACARRRGGLYFGADVGTGTGVSALVEASVGAVVKAVCGAGGAWAAIGGGGGFWAAGCFGANVGANGSANGDCFGCGCRLFMAGGGAFEAGLGAVACARRRGGLYFGADVGTGTGVSALVEAGVGAVVGLFVVQAVLGQRLVVVEGFANVGANGSANGDCFGGGCRLFMAGGGAFEAGLGAVACARRRGGFYFGVDVGTGTGVSALVEAGVGAVVGAVCGAGGAWAAIGGGGGFWAAGCFGANVGANGSANGDCFGGGCRLFMAGGGAFEAGLGAVACARRRGGLYFGADVGTRAGVSALVEAGVGAVVGLFVVQAVLRQRLVVVEGFAVRAAGCFGANVGANGSANGDCFGGGCRLFMAGDGAFEAGLGAVACARRRGGLYFGADVGTGTGVSALVEAGVGAVVGAVCGAGGAWAAIGGGGGFWSLSASSRIQSHACQLEDIIWDDLDRGDDHIVPHPTNAHTSKNSSERDSHNKLRRETTPVLRNTGNLDDSHTICQEKTEKDSKPLDKKKKIMEKESPSHAPHGVFNDSCDGEIVKDMPNLASDDIRMQDDCFKGSYATSATGDNNSYSYTPTQLSQAGDLCFVDNNCEDKDSGDLLYYGWPDIGNFEDVDKMLRGCDSSFGLGVTDNDGELGWFTSDRIEGTEEALKMDFKFPCPEPSGLKNILHPDHGSSESNNHRSSCISESKDELNYRDQINLQKRQSKHHNQAEGKKARKGVGNNDGSFYQVSDLRSTDCRLSSNNKSDQAFTSVGNRQQYRNLELDYFGHMQSNSYLPPDYPHQTTTVPMLSGIKSEHKGLKSPSPRGSSYASNQSSGDPSFAGTAAETDEQKQSQGFQPIFIGSPRQMGIMFQSSKGFLVSDEKQGNLSVKEHVSRRDIEGDQKGVDTGLLNVQESSSVSSGLDEISLEATSFRQLRQVMEQLDLRTKLCIRDSLYRLARSAEQRHNNPSVSSGATDANDLGGPLMSERTNKCTGFIDMETDTNPIDRSIAHLLFHRPSESHNLPSPFPPQPNLNHGSFPRRSILGEKLVCEQEAAGESNDTMGGDGI